MVASSDPDSYGQMRSFVLPGGSLPDGPITATDNIQSDDAVARLRRDICTGQALCHRSTPSIIPIGNSILYVQSFFVSGTDLGAPNLEQVIVAYQSASETRVEVDATFRGALVKLFGDDVPTEIAATPILDGAEGPDDPADPEPGGEPTDPGTTGTTEPTDPTGESPEVQRLRLIGELEAAFQRADAAARRGDMVAYSREVQAARDIAAVLAALSGGDGGDGPPDETTTPTTAAGGGGSSGSAPTTSEPPPTTTGA
jgi:uncharacterized membrane protein (UPF0182 family)